MRRQFLAIPSAILLSLIVAGSALGAFCTSESKQDVAGHTVVLWVDLSTTP